MSALERVAAVVLAAGSGQRMGATLNKPYLTLGGKPLLYYSLQRLAELSAVQELVLVIRPADQERCQDDILRPYSFRLPIEVALGGTLRQDSTLAGLAALSEPPDLVLVHDGVRPFFSLQLAERLIEMARRQRAALPALSVQDTIRPVNDEGLVGPALERQRLVLSQTPQCYQYDLLSQALRQADAAGRSFSDEAGAVLALTGVAARLIPGEPRNFKITTPADLELAEALLDHS